MTTPGLHERVLSRLGPAIVAGEPAPGEVLRLEQLEARYGVSRTVVREVVKVLESMHVVTSRRRVGVTVRPREEWNLFDPRMIRWRLAGADRMEQLSSLSQLRSAVEPVAAALAARHATPEHCGRLTAAVIGMSVSARKGDLEEYLRHDIAFHHAVLEGSGNEMFAGLTQVVAEVLAGRTHHHLMPAHPEPEAIRLHAEVADAIQAGDPGRAERAMRSIVQEAIEAMEAMAAEPEGQEGAQGEAGVPRPRRTPRRAGVPSAQHATRRAAATGAATTGAATTGAATTGAARTGAAVKGAVPKGAAAGGAVRATKRAGDVPGPDVSRRR